MIDWDKIETVLLDMDGTLLDLHFDNHFWLKHVPRRYAEKHGLSEEQARNECFGRYERVAGTLDWYCVDYWTDELGLDIALLKQEVDHLIAVHPHVVEFLEHLKDMKKARVLVTNAHQKSLAIKMEKTRLAGHLDQIITSHELGLPKETHEFWDRLKQRVDYHPDRTLLVEDSLAVLRAANKYGIAHLLCMLNPDSKSAAQSTEEFPSASGFRQLMSKKVVQ